MDADKGLSIIMPVYNEEEILESSVRKVKEEVRKLSFNTELVIVDDKSLDRSAVIADKLAADFENTRVMHHEYNQGIGGAFKTGISNSKYDWVILWPADNPFDSGEIERFFAETGNAEIVIGYRTGRPGYKRWVAFASRFYNLILRSLFKVNLRDFNWIHLYNKKIFKDIDVGSNGIVFFAELLIKAFRRGYRIQEVKSSMAPRVSGISTVSRPTVIIKTFFGLMRLWKDLR